MLWVAAMQLLQHEIQNRLGWSYLRMRRTGMGRRHRAAMKRHLAQGYLSAETLGIVSVDAMRLLAA